MNTLVNKVYDKLGTTRSFYQLKMDELKTKLKADEQFIQKVLNIVPNIEQIAHEKKMNIEDFSITEKRVKLSLVPKEESKFIFIKDQGYTSKGAGRNQKQLNTKAEKIEKWFTDKIENISVNVNQFSLEQSPINKILCDFYFNNK